MYIYTHYEVCTLQINNNNPQISCQTLKLISSFLKILLVMVSLRYSITFHNFHFNFFNLNASGVIYIPFLPYAWCQWYKFINSILKNCLKKFPCFFSAHRVHDIRPIDVMKCCMRMLSKSALLTSYLMILWAWFFLLLDVASPQEVHFAICCAFFHTLYMWCILHKLTSALLCVPFIFAHSKSVYIGLWWLSRKSSII